MKTEVKRLPRSQIEVKVVVPQKRVGGVLERIISQAVQEIKVEGFRKGNAPKNLAREKLDMEKVYGEVLNTAISEAYAAAVKEHHLKPITAPKIELLQFDQEAKKDLVFKATAAERPKVELGDYKQALTTLKTGRKVEKPKEEIVGPDGQPLKSSSSPSRPSVNEALETTLKTAKVEIPDLLIETEVNRLLSRLVDQTAKLGLTVEQYLQSQGKTAESLREEYRKQARASLKTEFVLDEIANLEKIEVTEEDINKAIQANPDAKAQAELEKQENRWYIGSVLRRNKTLQRLLDPAR